MNSNANVVQLREDYFPEEYTNSWDTLETRELDCRYEEEKGIVKARHIGERYVAEKRKLVRTVVESLSSIHYEGKLTLVEAHQHSAELLSEIEDDVTREQLFRLFAHFDRELGVTMDRVFKTTEEEFISLLKLGFLPRRVLEPPPEEKKKPLEPVVEDIPVGIIDALRRKKRITYYR